MLLALYQLQIPPNAMDNLIELLKERSVLEVAATLDPIVDDIVTNYTGTHFTVREPSVHGSAQKGTRPGHPYADLVFSFAFYQVLAATSKRMDVSDLRLLSH